MTKVARCLSLFLCLFAFLAPSAHAATYIVPPDAEMIQQSDDIVIARAVSSRAERDGRGAIVTRYVLHVDQVLKGDRSAGQQFEVTEQGGILDGKARVIGGTPSYEAEKQYLIFTSSGPEMEPATFGMSLGQFFLVDVGGQKLAVRSGIDGFDRNDMEAHEERPRNLERFMTYIRETLAHRPAPVDYFVSEGADAQNEALKVAVNAGFSRGSYLLPGNFRWQSSPSATFVLSGWNNTSPPITITAAEAASVSTAASEWSAAGVGIDYGVGPVDNTASKGTIEDDGKNAVLFGDPNSEVDSPAVARGGAFGDFQYPLDGETFINIFEVDIVVEAGLATCLDSVMTHEMGHTLGLRHSGEAPSGKACGTTADCTSSAIMNAVLGGSLCARNGALLTWDQDAVATVYGSGPVCNAVAITAQPQNRNINLGASTTLSVTATGTAPITYAWYAGNVGNTSTPVGGNSSSINVSPGETTTYWVRVTNACTPTPVDSAAATVTVTCASPAITSQPSGGTITEGQQATLQVGATGSGLSYQWYQGASGVTVQPVGANSPSLNVAPTSTTQYWVRVSGACGSPVDSQAVTVTVIPCGEVEVQTPTASPNPGIGNYRLNVNAFSSNTPLQFQWFRGTTPGFGGTLIGSTQAVNVTVTAVTSYWARVTNGCGKSAVTALITVAPCTLPSIATQPEDKTITTNNTTTLTVGVEGSGVTVKWYRGAVGDRTNEVGNTASVTVGPLFATTTYWAELTNTCGSVASRLVTITVDPATTNLFILNRRFNVQVRYRNQFANPPSEGLLIGKSLLASSLSDTAIFWFDTPLVVELMVRVSDARPFDNAFHVYIGGLSDVEFFITVKDTVTGKTVEYQKPANSLVGQIDRKSFPTGTSFSDAMDSLVASNTPFKFAPNADTSTLRMLNRYDVRVRYRNQFANPATEGFLLGRSITKVSSTETAVFYFENPESVEWIVRFSDVRPFANRVDFFHGGLSDVQYTVEVTDTVTGAQRSYPVAPFSLAGGVDRVSFTP